MGVRRRKDILRIWVLSISAADANSYEPMKCGYHGLRWQIMLKLYQKNEPVTLHPAQLSKARSGPYNALIIKIFGFYLLFFASNLSQPNTTYLSFCSPKPFFDSAPVLVILWLFTTPLSSKRIMRLLVMVVDPPYKGMEDVLVSDHS